MVRNEHIRGTTGVVRASTKITEKRLKWYGHVMRMKEEHIVRRMLDVDIPGKRRRGWPNLSCKDRYDRVRVERRQHNKQGSMENEVTAMPVLPDNGTRQG